LHLADKKCHSEFLICCSLKTFFSRIDKVNEMEVVGTENAAKSCKVHNNGWETMLNEKEDTVLITREACDYLRISRPTYLRYLHTGRIKATKAGKGWGVFKSELERFLKGDNGDESPKMPPQKTILEIRFKKVIE